MQGSLRIQLFGIPRIKVEPPNTSDLPTQKAKFLFFYLLLFHKNAHLRETLETIFWGDHPEPRARRSLSTEIWRLRRWIAPLQENGDALLSIQEGQIRLRMAASWWLDTFEFERYLAQAQQIEATDPDRAIDLLHRAVQLYSGELLEGCYYDWCFAERERLHQAYLDALLKIMVYHGARSEYTTAIQYGQRLLLQDPLQEHVHRELIKLYLLSHQQPQALAQYQACDRILRDELGIPPAPETQALMRQAVTGQMDWARAGSAVVARETRDQTFYIQSLAAHVRAALKQIEGIQRDLQDALQSLDELQVQQPRPKK